MQHETTDRPLVLAVDPEGAKLKPAEVVQIHKMHAQGIGWGRIAEEIGTTKKNVGRIVTGRRWTQLHPTRRPDLYREGMMRAEERATKPALVVQADDPLAATIKRIYDALSEAA